MHYLLIPGAWAGSWLWDGVSDRLRHRGHSVDAVTLPGLDADGAHAQGTTLDDHIEAVLSHLSRSAPDASILVGHSYASVLAAHVAGRLQDLVARVGIVEGFVPLPDRSLLDISGLDVAVEQELIANNDGLWPCPTRDALQQEPHLTASMVDLLASRQLDHPGQTVTTPVPMPVDPSRLRIRFISASAPADLDLATGSADRPTWSHTRIHGGHWPMLTLPDELAAILDDMAQGGP